MSFGSRSASITANAHLQLSTIQEVDPESRQAHLIGYLTGNSIQVPEGFAVVTPYIFVSGGNEYVRFLEAAFGASEINRRVTPSGRIANCRIKFGTAIIMLSEASDEFTLSYAASYIYLKDVHASMKRALEATAEKILDVTDMAYGDRQGRARDRFGNIWWVFRRLSAAPYF